MTRCNKKHPPQPQITSLTASFWRPAFCRSHETVSGKIDSNIQGAGKNHGEPWVSCRFFCRFFTSSQWILPPWAVEWVAHWGCFHPRPWHRFHLSPPGMENERLATTTRCFVERSDCLVQHGSTRFNCSTASFLFLGQASPHWLQKKRVSCMLMNSRKYHNCPSTNNEKPPLKTREPPRANAPWGTPGTPQIRVWARVVHPAYTK